MSCANKELPFDGSQSPLMFNHDEVQQTDTIVILIPGALAPIEMFAPTNAWRKCGYALAYYRFPGLDGLPLDHKLGIENAARQIADFANQYPGKRIRLIGYSTGGPIVILASQEIRSDDVKVAAMSSAVPKAGGFTTAMRGAYDVLAAAIRARSLNRKDIWLEYYRTLLFGRKGLTSPDLADALDHFVEQEKDNIIVPDSLLSYSHSGDLRNWILPDGFHADSENVRFFVGAEDPVFSIEQTREFAEAIGVSMIQEYPSSGHLLFLTMPEVFDDIYSFFENKTD